AKDAYGLPWRIARALLKISDEGLLRRVLTSPKDNLEYHLDFHGWHQEPSPEFLRVVGRLTNDGITDINPTARRLWQEKQPQQFKPKEVELTEVQSKTLNKALTFCERVGFSVSDYP